MKSDSSRSSRSLRSGTYVQQPQKYKAFIPNPLPPTPPLEISRALQVLLSQADRALGRLDGSVTTLPNPDLFVYMSIRREAVLSSQIEGTQSSLQDVLSAEAKIFSPKLPTDVDEVVNYVRAMNYGLARLATLPISVRLICEIHNELLQGARGSHLEPGELRRSQNWIGPAGCGLNDASFVPPPHHMLFDLLGQLESFLHQDPELPLLIKIGLAHAQFETIHPFLDGNGRVGRLLITLLLCHHQVLSRPVLYLSIFFKRYRTEYYDRLQSVRDHGDWEGWIEFFIRGVADVSEQATTTARRVLLLREQHRQQVGSGLGRTAANGHKLLEHLYEHPLVSVQDVQTALQCNYQTANQLVNRFVDLGILHEFTGQVRNRRFKYEQYIDLFSEETVDRSDD